MNISYEEEFSLVRGILLAAGLPEEDADCIATVIRHSDFTGVYSHGLSRLTRYLRQLHNGSLNPKPQRRVLLDQQAVTVFDGDNGSGIVTMNQAFAPTAEKARQYGIAISVGRRNANIGCGSYYGLRAAEEKLVGIFTCNTYAFTSPFGGADRLIGTNPLIFAAPAGGAYPLVLDMSTTHVAMGKIQAAEREGLSIPADWAKDRDGKPTTNPSDAFSLSPIAGHKGYGLAVMIDVLSTMLSGACYGTDIGLFSKLEPENTGFCMILIDPSHFMPLSEFEAAAGRYVRMMKESRRAPGVEEIFLPGEIEFRKMDEMKKNGFSVSEALQKELSSLAAELGAVEEGTDFASLLQAMKQRA